MSFDLTLFSGEGETLDRESFFAYFEGQKHVELSDDEVNYSNEDTGVYFTLTFSERDEVVPEDPNQARQPGTVIYFNMNFVRPGFFALEAAQVLSRLSERFSLIADDPQSNGMARGPFDADAFVRSWTGSNRWACHAIGAMGGAMGGGDRLHLPQALNEAFWRWNYYRDDMNEDLWADLIGTFVPLVMFYREGDQARTFCIFPNLIPTAVPKVDRIFVMRSELPAPYAKKSNPTPGWVTWDELVSAMPGYEIRAGGERHPYLILFRECEYESAEMVPKALARWVIGLPDWPDKPDVISPSTILDTEVIRPVDGV